MQNEHIEFYVMENINLKPGKKGAYHAYAQQHLERGGLEFIAAFDVIAGPETTPHVKNLYKVTDFNVWLDYQKNNELSEEWSGYCRDINYTVMDMLPYSVFDRFYLKDGKQRDGDVYYFFADIELRGGKVERYHDYWPNELKGIEVHSDSGADMAVTFMTIAAPESTFRVKRLFRITDINKWADGEVTFHYNDETWAAVASYVKTTVMYLQPYSKLI